MHAVLHTYSKAKAFFFFLPFDRWRLARLQNDCATDGEANFDFNKLFERQRQTLVRTVRSFVRRI